MENAQIIVVEDNQMQLTLLRRILSDGGHQVIVTATNMPEARAAIADSEEGSWDVAIIDGNLTRGSYRC